MRRFFIIATGILFGLAVPAAAQPDITVVNMIPAALSSETNQDSEPNLAVNPNDPTNIAGSAFTSGVGVCPRERAPIFVSTDEGTTWAFNCIVPSDASGMTSDITVRFADDSDILYGGILRRPGGLRLNILRTTNFTGASVMTVLEDRQSVDQPYIQARSNDGTDQVFVGDNDFAAGSATATIDQSLDAIIPAPVFTSVRIEGRATSGQDGPPIRPAISPDGTIYAAFYGWRAFNGSSATTDVVVVRDDNGGTGPTPFTSLLDSNDGLVGQRVVQSRTVPWANFVQNDFCQERFVGSNISIATDPKNSDIAYVAWAERVGNNDYTLFVRRTEDRGATWSPDLFTVENATNPALAINQDGVVGFLYQQCVTEIPGEVQGARWITHVQLTDDGFTSTDDLVLANVPADSPAPTFIPYIGDYVHLMAVGRDFYGIFSANNTPDMANYPNGVTYQRVADFSQQTLFDNTGKKVNISIDPYYFKVSPEPKKETIYKYAAKIVCGLQEDPMDMRLAQGFYATTINIHNPDAEVAEFKKSLSLTYPPRKQRPGKVIPIAEDRLEEDQALAVDCVDIRQRLFPNGFPLTYIEGFVTITSNVSLDVTAVYSTRGLEYKNCSGSVCAKRKSDCCGIHQGCCESNRDCCENACSEDRQKCCGGGERECGSCCVTVPGAHSSIDVEQITERVVERIPPPDEEEKLPDLVPVKPFDPAPQDNLQHLPQNFCLSPDDGLIPADAIRVVVRNLGPGNAEQTITTVQFSEPFTGPVGTVSQNTMALPAGAEQPLDFEIPDGCYGGGGAGCNFEISVNAGEPAIDEVTEANNTTNGGCPGLAP